MAKDRGYAWVVCAASFLVQVVIGGFIYTSGIFYIMFKNGIDASDSALSLITSLNMGILLVVGPAAGMLSDRYGERCIAILGAFLSTVGLAVSAFTTQVYQLYIFYGFFAGVGLGMTYNPSVSILNKYFNRHRRMVCACAMCGLGAGSFIIPPLLTALEEYYGWRGAILILAGINSHNMVLSCMFRPIEEHQVEQEGSMDADVDEEVVMAVIEKNERQISLNGIGIVTGVDNEKALDQQNGNGSRDLNKVHGSSWSITKNASDIKSFFTSHNKSSSDVNNLHRSSSDTNELNKCSDDIKGPYKSSSDMNKSKSFSDLEICTKGPNASDSLIERLLSLFRIMPFLCLLVCNLITQFIMAIVYTHFGNYALTLGYSESDVVGLYMATGITSTLCRPLMGFMVQVTNANAAAVILITNVVNGILTMALPLTSNLVLLYVYIIMFSVLRNPFSILCYSFTMESVPAAQMSAGFGLVCFFGTPGTVLGAPLAAWLYTCTNIYDYSFYLAGGLMVMAGLTMSPAAYTIFKNRRAKAAARRTL